MSSSTTGTKETISELIGIYHADGSAVGEMKYFFGKMVGRAHCSLCDITHGAFREKDKFKKIRENLGVAWSTVHLDERSPELKTFSEGMTPCVVGKTKKGFALVLDAAELELCKKDPDAFEAKITSALKKSFTIDSTV